MIKMVDLDSYIQQDPREGMLTSFRKLNKDLGSLETTKGRQRSKKQLIVVNQTLSQVTSYIDTGERPEVLLANLSNKAEQYASSDVLMSKVSPTSAAEAEPKSEGIGPVIDIEIKEPDIRSANFLKTAEAPADMQEHISIYDSKEDARPQSFRIADGQQLIY